MRLRDKIPQDQAAYQPSRSTTEHVFAVKQLAEKTIQPSNYKIYILMLGRPKAFDTVNRKLLLDQLDKILELFLLSVLINETTLQIKVDKHLSEKIQTTTGIIQGDCLSATLFIFYLASCLNSPQAKINPNNEKFLIEPKYADDIIWVTTSKQHIENAKSKIPIQLA